ncbi:MAG TPA: VOC family protein [Streptosporangiaceae bacterium]|jgi:PhnB protein
MSGEVNPIPSNYRRINTCLIVNGAAKAIEFYAEVFGATERSRFPGPGDTISHAELEIGDSVLMVEDAAEFMGTQAPPAGGLVGSPVYNFIYVEDVDATVDKAVKLGAELKRPVTDQFYGDRDGFIVDPFGHSWVVASHKEDPTPEELASRMAAMFGEG